MEGQHRRTYSWRWECGVDEREGRPDAWVADIHPPEPDEEEGLELGREAGQSLLTGPVEGRSTGRLHAPERGKQPRKGRWRPAWARPGVPVPGRGRGGRTCTGRDAPRLGDASVVTPSLPCHPLGLQTSQPRPSHVLRQAQGAEWLQALSVWLSAGAPCPGQGWGLGEQRQLASGF